MFTSIDLTKPRYDQSTFLGRLRHFSETTDIRNVLVSDKTLEESRILVDRCLKGEKVEASEEKIWEAKKLVDSTFHSDTGEKILLPFRMSSFVPTNLIVTAGLLLPNPGMGTIVLWQWVNQSVNVGFNYFNANKTTPLDMNETLVAYSLAVGSSCSLALGLNRVVSRWGFVRVLPFVPFVAVATAGVLNVGLMRIKELRDGISVFDERGDEVGKSTVAGWTAVSQVALSRVASAFPALTLPPLIMAQLGKTRMLKSFPRLALPLNFALIAASLSLALPPAIALFPQKSTIAVEKLESKFWNLQDSTGRKISSVVYNKGL